MDMKTKLIKLYGAQAACDLSTLAAQDAGSKPDCASCTYFLEHVPAEQTHCMIVQMFRDFGVSQ